jgi:hypothetical protein
MDRRVLIGRAVVIAMAIGVIAGGSHYWSKAGATEEMFWQDGGECARTAAPNPTAAAHGIVNDRIYRACLTARGWPRARHVDPAPPAASSETGRRVRHGL